MEPAGAVSSSRQMRARRILRAARRGCRKFRAAPLKRVLPSTGASDQPGLIAMFKFLFLEPREGHNDLVPNMTVDAPNLAKSLQPFGKGTLKRAVRATGKYA